MKNIRNLFLNKKVLLGLILMNYSLYAHSALMDCVDNGDNTITCSAGFSDGSSAQGVDLYILKNEKKNI